MTFSESFLGGGTFDEDEELLRFRFRVFNALLFFGMCSSLIFLIGNATGSNRLPPQDSYTIAAHLIVCIVTRALLHGHKERYLFLGTIYMVVCLWVFMAAQIWVLNDELRVLWFYVNVPGVYLLLGRWMGIAITVISMVSIYTINRFVPSYSTNAMTTGMVGLVYISAFFYLYDNRFRSFHDRLREANEKLQVLANTDTLTGLLNARTFYTVCNRLIALSKREGQPYSMLFVDLDHFKRINDKHGHDVGDFVLQTASKCLTETVRRSDVVGRIGGEEFSIFLPNTDLEGARVLAEKIRLRIEQASPSTREITIPITASIGVALGSPRHQNVANIQRDADLAMYEAKKQGRNRVTAFTEKIAC